MAAYFIGLASILVLIVFYGGYCLSNKKHFPKICLLSQVHVSKTYHYFLLFHHKKRFPMHKTRKCIICRTNAHPLLRRYDCRTTRIVKRCNVLKFCTYHSEHCTNVSPGYSLFLQNKKYFRILVIKSPLSMPRHWGANADNPHSDLVVPWKFHRKHCR